MVERRFEPVADLYFISLHIILNLSHSAGCSFIRALFKVLSTVYLLQGWYVYLNPLHWAWGSLMVNQFTAIPPILIYGGTEVNPTEQPLSQCEREDW